MTPQQHRELNLWLDHYAATTARADDNATAATWASYAAIDDWQDPAQTIPAALAAARTAQTVRQINAGMANEFIGFVINVLTGQRPRPVRGVPPYSRNAEPVDVYSRPIHAYRRAIAAGQDERIAELLAAQRVEMLAMTDALLARRDAVMIAMEEISEITGYRRVIRPELSQTGVCGLCIAASTRIYSVEDLLPIHTRCKCTVMPVLSDEDPGARFNDEDLEEVYASTPGTTRDELSKTRYKVEDNAELGPVLVPVEIQKSVPRAGGADPIDELVTGGGDDDPPRPPADAPGAADEPDDPDSPEGRAYWARRRDALGLDFGDEADQVRAPEIKTVERLQRRGDTLVPIPRDTVNWHSTSDYDWTPAGDDEPIRIEIKSLLDTTRLNKATFPTRLKKAVGKSKAHGADARKRNFVLDAGDRTVLDEVRGTLRSFNRDNPDHRVDRVWLMSNGTLEEIELE